MEPRTWEGVEPEIVRCCSPRSFEATRVDLSGVASGEMKGEGEGKNGGGRRGDNDEVGEKGKNEDKRVKWGWREMGIKILEACGGRWRDGKRWKETISLRGDTRGRKGGSNFSRIIARDKCLLMLTNGGRC